MAASAEESESLETWLNKATNPLMREEDWESIVGFCDQVNKDLEGPQTAVRLLIHKIQSPQEKESMLALTTLEACVKNCGRKFQQEIGKFRFINEIIKVVSPKYLGNHMSDRVKKKCIELLYSWSEVLTHEPKIKEAYQMLRRQGIVKQDPVVSDQTLEAAPPPQPRNSIFDDEEKSKLLSRLLKSKNPEDLQAANRLIKNMVKQETERTEKVSRRVQQLETVSNNVKLLSEMLNNHNPESSTESDKEIMKELYDNLEKQRPNLFRLASDTDENDSTGISDILKANDEVVQVMALYGQVINNASVANLLEPGEKKEEKSSFLKDLEFLSNSATSLSSQSRIEPLGSSLLDEQLLSLGLEGSGAQNGLSSELHAGHTDDLDDIFGPVKSAETASNSATSDMFGLPNTTKSSSFGFGSAAMPFGTPSALSASSSPHVSLRTSAPAPGYGLGAGLAAPIVPASSGGRGDLFASGAGSVHAGTKPSQHLLTNELSELFRPSDSASDSCILLGSESKGTAATSSGKTSAGLDFLSEISRNLLEQSLSNSGLKPYQPAPPAPKIPLMQMAKTTAAAAAAAPASTTSTQSASSSASLVSSVNASPSAGIALAKSASPVPTLLSSVATGVEKVPGAKSNDVREIPEANSLEDVFVPLETIRPGSQEPIVAYNKNSLKIMFHLGKDRPRPDVQVFAITTTSTSQSAIKNFNFQAAVPKVMKIQLQPASGADLSAYNPILPPSAITQVMLISHPPHEKIRLKFKITYSVNDAIVTDVGDVEDIPAE